MLICITLSLAVSLFLIALQSQMLSLGGKDFDQVNFVGIPYPDDVTGDNALINFIFNKYVDFTLKFHL